MKKIFAVLGIVAGAFLVAGGILIGIGFAMGAKGSVRLLGFANINVGRGELISQEYMKLDEFDSIYVDMDYGDVQIIPAEEYGIEYRLFSDNVRCEVKNGGLIFEERARDGIFNFDFFGIGTHSDSYVKLYVPEKKLSSVELYMDMGEADIKGIDCRRLKIDCDMGSVECADVSAETVYFDLDMGSLDFEGTVTGRTEADLDMGDLNMEGWLDCDISIDSDMGAVDLATYYSYNSYRCELDADMGSDSIHDNGGADSKEIHRMVINCDMGSIDVTFKDAG